MPPAPSALPRPSSPPPAPPQPVRRRPARPAPSRRQHRAHPSPGTGRQKADGGAGRQELHWLLAPCARALYPLPRRSASLGPASGQTDRGTMGPSRSSGWRGRGSPGPNPGGQRVATGRARGGEARGVAVDGQSQRQTDGQRGKKMATRAAGARCSRSRSEWGACRNLTSLLPPPPGPLPAPEARAWRYGRGLRERVREGGT